MGDMGVIQETEKYADECAGEKEWKGEFIYLSEGEGACN